MENSFPDIKLETAYLNLSNDWVGWFGWILLFMVLGSLVWKKSQVSNLAYISKTRLLFILLLTSPFFTLIESHNLNAFLTEKNGLQIAYLAIFSAIPWVIAAGDLGVVPSVIIGGFSGLILALWRTHSIFTPLEIGMVACIFSSLVSLKRSNRYTDFIRNPFIALLITLIFYIPFSIILNFIGGDGTFSQRIDFVFSNIFSSAILRVIEILAGGIIGIIILTLYNKYVRSPEKTKINSIINNPRGKEINWIIPFSIGLVTFLLIGSWIVAGNVARGMLVERLEMNANAASESLPLFLETGQNLISNMNGEEFLVSNSKDLTALLNRKIHEVPFFNGLILLNIAGDMIVSNSPQTQGQGALTDEEKKGFQLALKGITNQSYSLPLVSKGRSVQVSFFSAIKNDSGQIKRVLVGRTNLDNNPFIEPVLQSFKYIESTDGEGIILGNDNQVLFSTNSVGLLTEYNGIIPPASEISAEISLSGIKKYIYYKPVVGQPWSILLIVPAEYLQHLAFNISIPFLIFILILALGVIIFWRIYLKNLSNSMTFLASRAALISQGSIDQPLPVKSSDEVGKFEIAFEQMRASLKVRLDELNNLLVVSQGVASNLDIGEAIRPVLEAYLGNDGISSRAVLTSKVLLKPGTSDLISFGQGAETDTLAYLDSQIINLMADQTILIIPNTFRMRRIKFSNNQNTPGALIAFALRLENIYFGTIWAAYKNSRNFSDQEINYFTTLAGHGALAASNSRLYAAAEIGRRQLEAVLASTPEPVLVIDMDSRLLLANQAAVKIEYLLISSTPGIEINKAISNKELLDLINSQSEGNLKSQEVSFPKGKIYLASLSPVVSGGKPIGKICLLKDISIYKELDTIKSEFVSTVSHDLRAPLALTKSYATMLKMVGELNDQQTGYVEKIVAGVENMTRLVNNLLDLGRIDAGVDLKIEQISAYQVIENVANSLQPQANQKTIQLSYDAPTYVPVVIEADPALLQQALYNLVENSIKYTMVGGKVHLGLQLRKEYIIFVVRDTGIGIAPLDVPHLFEKFYRIGKKDPSQTTGTSLGLAIVKSIAEHHHGSVMVESQLGKGSTFYLEIPYQQQKNSRGNLS